MWQEVEGVLRFGRDGKHAHMLKHFATILGFTAQHVVLKSRASSSSGRSPTVPLEDISHLSWPLLRNSLKKKVELPFLVCLGPTGTLDNKLRTATSLRWAPPQTPPAPSVPHVVGQTSLLRPMPTRSPLAQSFPGQAGC